MPNSFSDVKKENLEERFALLCKQYNAAYIQLNYELSAANRVAINEQIKYLEGEIQKVESELGQLESSAGDANLLHRNFERKLPEIDYKQAKGIVQDILERFGGGGGAALFLLQKSETMGGKWLMARIKEILDVQAREVKPYQVELPPGARLDEIGLLDRLAEHFNVGPMPNDLEKYAQAIIRKIRDSVYGGKTILIELRKWDVLFPQERILPWFLKHFWVPLVHELPTIAQTYRNVKFVGVLSADTTIPKGCLDPSLCCTPEQFHSEKILKLPLQNWTQDEILEWLERYSNIIVTNIEQEAKRIYEASQQGLPPLVYSQLIYHFK